MNGEAVLRCAGIWTSFGGVSVHRGVDLELRGGEIAGLIGANGCGKSTLLNVVTGVVRPDRGRVELDGRDVTSMASYRRHRLGILRSFQNLELFEELTVRDNLRVPIVDRRREKEILSGLLRDSGLEERASDLPADLAYGQRKALSLARLRGRPARVVLLDEPAAGLTAAEIAPILDIARKLAAGGAAVCFVEHNMRVMSDYADTVHLMHNGAIVASGPPQALMSDPDLARIFFGTAA